jgi:hypothetical protein
MSNTALIAKCEDFILAYQVLGDAARDENETAYERAAGEADRLINQLSEMAPTTSAGFRAKARAAALLRASAGSDISGDDDTSALARSLIADLAGIADGSSVVYFDRERRAVSIGGRKGWR